jgi:hypothetical protein
MSGELMPIPGHRIKLNVISVEKEYDDYTHNHKVVVEGICEKEKK